MEYKPITDICLNVTENCQCQCVYCFAECHPHSMSFQVAKDTTDWTINNAAHVGETGGIGFFGGEPLLEWDTIVVPLTKYIREELGNTELALGLTSNCLLMDKDKLEFLKQYNFGLLVSMDGDKNTQDYNRPCRDGRSSFDILDKKLPMILEYYPDATFRCTIIPDTCEYFCENLEYARQKGFNHAFAIINQFEEWPLEKRLILAKQVRQYSNYLIQSFREKKPFFRQRTLEQAINKIVAVNSMISAGLNQRIGDGIRGKVCGLGSGYGSVNYKGDIFSCQEVASRTGEKDIFYLGNIYTGGVEKERLDRLFNAAHQENNITCSAGTDKCLGCPLEATCDNNACIVNNYIQYKNFSVQSENICWWNNLMAVEAQYICQVLGEENNELFKDYFTWILTSQGGCFNYD